MFTPHANPAADRFAAFDLLATLVAVVRTDGLVIFANSALEDALGMSRRMIEGAPLSDCFTEPVIMQGALEGAGSIPEKRWRQKGGRGTHDE